MEGLVITAVVIVGVVLLLAVLALAFIVLRRLAPPSEPATRSSTGTAPAAAAAQTADARTVGAARTEAPDPTATQDAEHIRGEAKEQAALLLTEARSRADQVARDAQQTRHDIDDEIRGLRADVRDQRAELDRREQRLAEREDRLDGELRGLETKATHLDQVKAGLRERTAELELAGAEHGVELERIAGLTSDQARAELIASAESEAKRHATIIVRDIELKAQREGEATARSIIVGAIQRMASDQTTESVVTALHLPSDDMKGRIIGREGRNIRSFEQVTGVNVMIDDTPESVLLSCFDPVRRETARITMEELIEDGRIHPARIEEVHERSVGKINERCLRAAEDALAEVGISDLHPELIPILGSLRYRTSYGQNVLKHLVECAHLAGLMAAELGLDVAVCKRSAFLHDIGKALTHEVEGSHALTGADLARKVRRAGRRRARDRGPPQRGRAQDGRSGAHPGRRHDLRRTTWRTTREPGVLREAARTAGADRVEQGRGGQGVRHAGGSRDPGDGRPRGDRRHRRPGARA